MNNITNEYCKKHGRRLKSKKECWSMKNKVIIDSYIGIKNTIYN